MGNIQIQINKEKIDDVVKTIMERIPVQPHFSHMYFTIKPEVSSQVTISINQTNYPINIEELIKNFPLAIEMKIETPEEFKKFRKEYPILSEKYSPVELYMWLDSEKICDKIGRRPLGELVLNKNELKLYVDGLQYVDRVKLTKFGMYLDDKYTVNRRPVLFNQSELFDIEK